MVFGTAVIIGGIASDRASVFASMNDFGLSHQPEQYYAHAVHANPLFNQDGIDPVVAKAITDAVGTGSKNAGHFSDISLALGSANVTTQTDGALYIRLFDDTPAGTADATSFKVAPAELGGGARWWRPVALNNGVLTLWMAEPYARSQWNHSFAPYGQTWLRSRCIEDIQEVIESYPESAREVIEDRIVPAGDSRVSWQGGSGEIPAGDLAWLPSVGEVSSGTGSRRGSWSLNDLDRGYVTLPPYVVVPAIAWLRTPWRYDNLIQRFYSATVHSGGDMYEYSEGSPSANSRGVRPAIHIDINPFLGDYDNLSDTIETAESKYEAHYTPASWSNMQDKLNAGRNLLFNANTQHEIDIAVLELLLAMAELDKHDDIVALQYKMYLVSKLPETKYTEETWQDLMRARDVGLTVLQFNDPAGFIVENVLQDLLDAYDALERVAASIDTPAVSPPGQSNKGMRMGFIIAGILFLIAAIIIWATFWKRCEKEEKA